MVPHHLQQNIIDLYTAWKSASVACTQGHVNADLEIMRDAIHEIADKLGVDLHKTEGE